MAPPRVEGDERRDERGGDRANSEPFRGSRLREQADVASMTATTSVRTPVQNAPVASDVLDPTCQIP